MSYRRSHQSTGSLRNNWKDILPGSATVPVTFTSELFEKLANGTCNVLAGAPLLIYEKRARDQGFTGEYTFSSGLYSNEPLAFVTKGDDYEWADFVNWVFMALVAAETLNITQATASCFPYTTIGEAYENMFINAIAAVGNYGELYACLV
jgi:hypothetical protein